MNCTSIFGWPQEIRDVVYSQLSSHFLLELSGLHSQLVPDDLWAKKIRIEFGYQLYRMEDCCFLRLVGESLVIHSPSKCLVVKSWRMLYWLLRPLYYLGPRSRDFYHSDYCLLWSVLQGGVVEDVRTSVFTEKGLVLEAAARSGSFSCFQQTLRLFGIEGPDGKLYVRSSILDAWNFNWNNIIMHATLGGNDQIRQRVVDIARSYHTPLSVHAKRGHLELQLLGWARKGDAVRFQAALKYVQSVGFHVTESFITSLLHATLLGGNQEIFDTVKQLLPPLESTVISGPSWQTLSFLHPKDNHITLLEEEDDIDPTLLAQLPCSPPPEYTVYAAAKRGTLTMTELGTLLARCHVPDSDEEQIESINADDWENMSDREELLYAALLGAAQGKQWEIVSWLLVPEIGDEDNICYCSDSIVFWVSERGYSYLDRMRR